MTHAPTKTADTRRHTVILTVVRSHRPPKAPHHKGSVASRCSPCQTLRHSNIIPVGFFVWGVKVSQVFFWDLETTMSPLNSGALHTGCTEEPEGHEHQAALGPRGVEPSGHQFNVGVCCVLGTNAHARRKCSKEG